MATTVRPSTGRPGLPKQGLYYLLCLAFTLTLAPRTGNGRAIGK